MFLRPLYAVKGSPATFATLVFTSEVVTEVAANDEELRKDNEFRNTHYVAPGFKDRDKPDGGIGDKVVWRCILDVGAAERPL